MNEIDKEWFDSIIKHINDIPLSNGDRELFRNLAYTCYLQNDKVKRYSKAMVNMDNEIKKLKMYEANH